MVVPHHKHLKCGFVLPKGYCNHPVQVGVVGWDNTGLPYYFVLFFQTFLLMFVFLFLCVYVLMYWGYCMVYNFSMSCHDQYKNC